MLTATGDAKPKAQNKRAWICAFLTAPHPMHWSQSHKHKKPQNQPTSTYGSDPIRYVGTAHCTGLGGRWNIVRTNEKKLIRRNTNTGLHQEYKSGKQNSVLPLRRPDSNCRPGTNKGRTLQQLQLAGKFRRSSRHIEKGKCPTGQKFWCCLQKTPDQVVLSFQVIVGDFRIYILIICGLNVKFIQDLSGFDRLTHWTFANGDRWWMAALANRPTLPTAALALRDANVSTIHSPNHELT